jgi:hypothetical protein
MSPPGYCVAINVAKDLAGPSRWQPKGNSIPAWIESKDNMHESTCSAL